MPKPPIRRHPQNAKGDFYFAEGICVNCDGPSVRAPEFFGTVESANGGTQCIVRHQPQTPEEINRVIQAMESSCCGAMRYGGNDIRIIARLEASGNGNLCDWREVDKE